MSDRIDDGSDLFYFRRMLQRTAQQFFESKTPRHNGGMETTLSMYKEQGNNRTGVETVEVKFEFIDGVMNWIGIELC